MARMPRIVVPGYPHHVTQRGNRRQQTFFCDDDYRYYIELLSEYAQQANTEIWAYCLMPNHVHLVMVPDKEDGLRAALGETHQFGGQYTYLMAVNWLPAFLHWRPVYRLANRQCGI